ncbi:MAG: hypothetical protein BIFFINMI_02159 [Phycisphaerae bacterium]|nr:hypothetical protein [Phycisphaerae bacterium]
MLFHRYRLAAAAAALLLLAGGCSKKNASQPPPSQPAAGQSNHAQPSQSPPNQPVAPPSVADLVGPPPPLLDRPPVQVVQIVERNGDTFPGPLVEYDDAAPEGDEPAPPHCPFQVVAGRLVIGRDRPGDDPATDELVLSDPDTPLSACKLVVLHTIVYEGKGRTGQADRYYGFAGATGRLPLPRPPAGEKWEHDPSADDAPFTEAVRSVRLFPADGEAIVLEAAADGKLTVTLGAWKKELAAGASADADAQTRDLAVGELPVAAASVTDDDDLFNETPRPVGGAEALAPGTDHGRITFTTRLTVTNLGLLPAARPATANDKEGRP